jgi:iron complex transport system substrate-binding protein
MEQKIEQIARDVVDASVKLHGKLGPGLLESVYEVILCKELQKQGYRVERQRPIRIEYEGTVFDEGFRTDLWIGNCFIVELKSVEKLAPVHGKQLLTYLRLTGLRLGLLINFGEEILKNGLKRIAN